MEIRDLYDNLKEAYTPENLHLISSRIINMFREHQYDALRAIQKVVNEYTPCEEEKINKVFPRLIMIYHPDRLRQAQGELDGAFARGDFEMLFTMSHILHVQNLEPEHVSVSSILSDEDLAEEFGWDGQDDGYSYFMDQEEESGMEDEPDYMSRSFLNALKRRVYGNLNVDFPIYMLEDLEEIEMADYDLETLDGIEACHYAKAVDLSNNNLTDLGELGYLRQVEPCLYLSNNHIGEIDSLSELLVLQVLDISFNDVDDLSPLFDLNHLSYLNVIGNRVPGWQLEKLQQKGVAVIF